MLYRLVTIMFNCFEEVFKGITPLKINLTSKAEDAEAERINREERGFVVEFDFWQGKGVKRQQQTDAADHRCR